jgi:hypothetical protein
MHIYYIYFFITLIFFGIIVLIYYSFIKNIKKFNDISFIKNIEKFNDIENTILREENIKCSYSNTLNPFNSNCYNKTENEICKECPPGTEPDDSLFGDSGISCKRVTPCEIPCLSNIKSNFYKVQTDSNTEHLGYKLANTNILYSASNMDRLKGIKMQEQACIDFKCPEVNAEIESCDISKFPHEKILDYGEHVGRLCCKYKIPDAEVSVCPPDISECTSYKYENFPSEMRNGSPIYGVNLITASNAEGVLTTNTYNNGYVFAFRGSNFDISYQDRCPEDDEIYTQLSSNNNCVQKGIDMYCCLTGTNHKPAFLNDMYPSCDVSIVNILNSVNTTKNNYISSNLIQMYPGYNLFNTNIYHTIDSSNVRTYGYLSNDVYYDCIDSNGSLIDICKKSDENYNILDENIVSPGSQGDPGDITLLELINNLEPDSQRKLFGTNELIS